MSKFCIFSEVKGVVLDRGKPLAGATIERHYAWSWRKEKGTDSVETDAQGHFFMPAIFRSSFLGKILPHQPFIEQTLIIKHNDREYVAWTFDKLDYEENSELNGKLFSLTCDLQKKASRKGGFFGVCDI